MANSEREQQPTEESKNRKWSKIFMDSKENKLYYFIQLGLLRLENYQKILEKSSRRGIKDYFQRI